RWCSSGCVLAGCVILICPMLACGQLTTRSDRKESSSSASVRVALVVEESSATTAADLLTAELSTKDRIQLLERTEIDRIYREQGLSAANKDYLKLGQILGADGLLLLSRLREGTNQFLAARLVAVKTGVVIGAV